MTATFDVAMASMNELTESVFARLIKAAGRERGRRSGMEALDQLGLRELRTPDDLLRFAEHLMRRGGVIEAVGRALKITALLRGATESPRPPESA